MSLRPHLRIVILALLVVGSALNGVPSNAAVDRPNFSTSTAEIVKEEGDRIRLYLEVALSPEQQAYGLMFIQKMNDDHGMIFRFLPRQRVSFWMKNTLIPLDMLFIGRNGIISQIASNAKPGDLTPISSHGEIDAVLEVNGGFAEKHGIKVGDRVDSPVLLLR